MKIACKNKNIFIDPDFSKAKLEFRFEENHVIKIYGTSEGIQWLITQCENLINAPNQGHIHIDRRHDMLQLLTEQSLDAAIAIFSKKKTCEKIKYNRSILGFLFNKSPKYFCEPDFFNAGLEFRFEEDNVICIYGTSEGLSWFIAQCEELIENSWQGHVHIDSKHDVLQVLTKKSLEVRIAIFSNKETVNTFNKKNFWNKRIIFSGKNPQI